MLQKISTDKAPAAIGPYSQGIVLGNIFFASRQTAIVTPKRQSGKYRIQNGL